MRGLQRSPGHVKLYAVLLLITAAFVLVTQTSALTSVPAGEFNATPTDVYFNWSVGTLNITANNVSTVNYSINLAVLNTSTNIRANYSQDSPAKYGSASYPNLTTAMYDLCFVTSGTATMEFIVENATGVAINTTGLLNGSNSSLNNALMYLRPYMACPPGRYYGNFSVVNATNYTNVSEYIVNLNAIIHIPISPQNTYLEANNSAFFKGRIEQGTPYHSYYFWTNQTANITTITITLGNITGDVDLFLFNSQGRMTAKSINASTNSENITSVTLPATGELWELRLYGNQTSDYEGYLYFSTINITNTTLPNITIPLLNFSSMQPNQTLNKEFRLRNEDTLAATNVDQDFDVYRVVRFAGNSSREFFVFVPSLTTSFRAQVEWAAPVGQNVTDIDLYVRNSAGTLIGTSASKAYNANQSNATMEEFVLYEGSFNATNEGFWNVTIINASNNPFTGYNVTIFLWDNKSRWLSTNYTNDRVFNASNSTVNLSYDVSVNLTVPMSSIVNGTYEGWIDYFNGSGWRVRLPLSFQALAGNLMLNSSVRNYTIRLNDNIGFNRTGSSSLFVNVSLNNTGGLPVNYTNTTSSYQLFNVDSSNNRTMNLSVHNWPPNPIPAGYGDNLAINVTFNTNITGNEQGIYRGWVTFNTSNSNVINQSYPYDVFNLTIEVNLTNRLVVNIVQITPTLVTHSNATYPVTASVEVRLANGTVISIDPAMGLSNFTLLSITEKNVTTYTRNLTSIGAGGSGGVTCSGSSPCLVNGTVPANIVGGTYTLLADAYWTPPGTNFNLTGRGLNPTLKINGTGLHLTAITGSTISINEGSVVTYFNISAVNYGPNDASTALTMETMSGATIAANDNADGCINSISSNVFNIAMSGNGSEICWFRWKITSASDVSSTTTTAVNINSSDKNFGGIGPISVTINNVGNGSSSTPGSGGTPSGTTGCTADTGCNASAYCSISTGKCLSLSCSSSQKIQSHKCVDLSRTLSVTSTYDVLTMILSGANQTNVTVKNIGEIYMGVSLDVIISDNVTYNMSASKCGLPVSKDCTITVDFAAPDTSVIGSYSGTFKAYITNDSSVSATKDFTVDILPTEEKKTEITQSFEVYKALYTDVKDEFGQLSLSPSISEENKTTVSKLINQTDEVIVQIADAINAQDYITANVLLTDLDSRISAIRSLLDTIKQQSGFVPGFGGDLWTWAIIAVVVVVIVVLLVYMMLPGRSGYSPSYGTRAPKRDGKGPLSGLKEKFRRKPKTAKQQTQKEEKPGEEAKPTEEQKGYPEGYERHEGSEGYDFKK